MPAETMNPEEDRFNIRAVATDGLPAGLLKPGRLSLLGAPEEFDGHAHKFYMDILNSIDISKTFYRYDINVEKDGAETAAILDANIALPFTNMVNGVTELFIATAPADQLGIAAAELIREVEKLTEASTEELLSLYSIADPEGFRKLLIDLGRREEEDRRRRNAGNISFRGKKFIQPTESKICEDTAPPEPKAREESTKKISDKEIRDAYDSLPDRYSTLYEKRNPEAARILWQSLDMVDHRALVGLLFEAAKTDRNLLRKLQKAKETMASRLAIKVRRWSSDQKQYFKDNYRYCLYIADASGKELPVRFRSNPSYCLFMMYVLDRKMRGPAATGLSFKENREEFRRLYRTLFNEYEKLDSICGEMLHRTVSPGGALRKGRLDDYIKDINDTMDGLLGSPDSISVKVGHGRYLEIPGSHIDLDPTLPIFNFV